MWRSVFDNNILGVAVATDRFGVAVAEAPYSSSEPIGSRDDERTWPARDVDR